MKKKRENFGPAGRGRVISFERDGGDLLLSLPLRLLHDISIFVNANGLRNFAVHPGGHQVCVFVFFFSPFLFFRSPFPLSSSISSSSSDRNAASFCFGKLIQPDSPAAFNQRRFTIFSLRLLSVNFILPLLPQLLYPCASVVRCCVPCSFYRGLVLV